MKRKKIMLLGDSIMYGAKGIHGYGYYVRQKLENMADVFLPTDNCQDSRFTSCYFSDLIPESDGDFDVIHWNNGLWDVLHFAGNPKPHVSADNYRQALLTIYEKLLERYPRAAVVFAATTVVSEDLQKTASYRRNEEIAEYNDLARSALADKIDAIDDLYSVSLDLGDEYRAKDGLHYNEDGARYLAEAVCRFLKDHKYI